ncbi:MAG: TolC family protein [Candidatus Omnitrophica bacterium]|nr:TolC family protein [Candidatus Omnitrophota bacterium]
MKKTFLIPFTGLAVFTFTLLSDSSSLFKTFAYAEENLASFQQEVLLAKEKHRALTDKMKAVRLSMDSVSPASVDEIKVSDKPSQTIKIPVKKEAAKPKPEKLKDTPKKNWLWPFAAKPETISDGEALYKVAVSDGKITLKEAVEIGLANDLELEALKKKAEVAKAKLVEAKRALFPSVQASMLPPQTSGGKQPVGSTDAEFPAFRIFKTESYKVAVNQPLYYSGELVLTVRQAEVNVQAVEKEYHKAKNQFIHEVRSRYYAVVKAEYNAQYQIELYGETNPLHKRLEEEYRERVLSEVEHLNAQSKYQQVFFQAEAARNDLDVAALNLKQTLKISTDKKVPVYLRLGYKKISPTLNEVTELTLKNNPDLKVKEIAYEAAKLGVMIYQAKKGVHFDLKGSYGILGERIYDDRSYTTGQIGDHNGNIDFNRDKEWFLGVKGTLPIGPNSLEYERVKHVYAPTVIAPTGGSEDWSEKWTFNLLDKLSLITDEKSAQAAVLQAQSDYEKAKGEVLSKLREDFYNLQKSMIQIETSVSKLKYQEKQNAVLKYLLSMQETAPANFMEGLIEQAQNRFSFIQAVVDYHLAISSLNLSIGDPDHFETES